MADIGWCSKYVGIPFVEGGRDPAIGLDCWGLYRYVLVDHFGIEVAAYEEHRLCDGGGGSELAAFMSSELWRWDLIWHKSMPNDVMPLDLELRPADGLLIRMDGVPMHVGVIAEAPWFLHTEISTCCHLDEITSPRWRRRILGVYRIEASA